MTDPVIYNDLDIGDRRLLRGRFSGGTPQVAQDPDTVIFKIRNRSDANFTEFTYGSDPEVIREGVGNYYVWFTFDKSGTWYWRFQGIGKVEEASEGQARVSRSKVLQR